MAVPFVNTAQEVTGISRLRDSKGWKLIQTFLETFDPIYQDSQNMYVLF